MNTYFSEKELFYLYQQFLKLNPNEAGLIAKNQLLNIPELKFCAFKKYLTKALKLDEEDSVKMDISTEKDEKKENKKDSTVSIKQDDREESKAKEEGEILTLKENDKNKKIIEIQDKKKEEEKNESNKEEEKEDKNGKKDETKKEGNTSKDKIIVDNDENKPIGKQNIDFKKYCEILKIFNINTPIDEKIRFYFDIYDVDNDDKISKDDFSKILFELLPEDLLNDGKTEANKEAKENVEKIVNLIFKEVLGNEKHVYLEFDDFQKVLFQTNIDKTCVIHFGAENN